MITEHRFKNGKQDGQQLMAETKGARAMQRIGQLSRVKRIVIGAIAGGVLTVGSLAISPLAEWWAGASQDAQVAAAADQPNFSEVPGGYREYLLLQQDALAPANLSKLPPGKTDDDGRSTQQLQPRASQQAPLANDHTRTVDPSVLDHSPRPLYGHDHLRTVDPSVYGDQWAVTK
jgi:hypothetical protein